MMTGLKNTYHQVLNANGPAQMLTYAFWGVIVAGMFFRVDPSCFPDWLIISWGAVSAAVIPVTVWGSKNLLKYTLLLDTVFSAYILALLMLHSPHTQEFVYSIATVEGRTTASRGMAQHSISEWFHTLAVVWMSFHSLYLANLTQRQILEKKRFS